MASPPDFDVAIIGAGVVGCATARRFTLDGARVAIIEKSADVLDGASKANSAILHTGFDAPVNSLEQSCIADGYREFMNSRESLGLPVLKSGALVLAWNDEQIEQLDDLIAKAHENGVTDVSRVTRKQILSQEPSLNPTVREGFEIPGESLIDPWSTPHAYLNQALANGARLYRQTELESGEFDGHVWQLTTSRARVSAHTVVNCAGLYADRVDLRLTGETQFTIMPRKGQFVVFDKTASRYVSSSILPVPTKKTKGIVVCRTIFGNVLVGPTAEDQDSRDNSATDAQTLSRLHAQGQHIIPALANCEVTACYAGLRPATEHSDYKIEFKVDKNYVSVGGIRSTGLSSALGIANYVARRLSGTLAVESITQPITPAPLRLSDYHPRDWQEAGNGGIVCHCERVTRREITNALSGPLAPRSLDGLKRQTRVCMGRCQGFYCQGQVANLTRGKFDSVFALAEDI